MLPNTLNLVRLSQTLSCDPSNFLPKLSIDDDGTTFTSITEFDPAMVDNPRMRQTLSDMVESTGAFVYYLPITLPDAIKTDELLKFEYTSQRAGEMKDYVKSVREVLEKKVNGCILIDEGVLLDLANSCGIYDGFSRIHADRQIEHFLDFALLSFPHWQIKVVRRMHHQVSPCLLIGDTFLVLEFFHYTLRFHNQKAIEAVQNSLNQASRMSIDLVQWCEQNHSCGSSLDYG